MRACQILTRPLVVIVPIMPERQVKYFTHTPRF